nr:methionine biosynthesis protein MetW [Massilia oculi]
MPERICPACHADDTEAVDSVDREDLIHSYRQKGIEVGAYLHGASITLCHCNHCELGFFDPACVGDGLFYEQLQTQDWYYQDDKPEYAHAAKLIDQDSSVLEVGCGKGAFRSWLPQSVRYTGLEFNDEAVQKARAAGWTSGNSRSRSMSPRALATTSCALSRYWNMWSIPGSSSMPASRRSSPVEP